MPNKEVPRMESLSPAQRRHSQKIEAHRAAIRHHVRSPSLRSGVKMGAGILKEKARKFPWLFTSEGRRKFKESYGPSKELQRFELEAVKSARK